MAYDVELMAPKLTSNQAHISWFNHGDMLRFGLLVDIGGGWYLMLSQGRDADD